MNERRKYRGWTQKEIAYLKENYSKFRGKKCAKDLNRSLNSVYCYSKVLNLTSYAYSPRINKTCPKCKNTKDLKDFTNCHSNTDGKQAYCKECRREIANKYQQKRRINDPIYRQRCRTHGINFYKKHKEECLIKTRNYYLKNKTKMDKSNRKWRKENRIRLNDIQTEKLKNDLNFKIKHYFRNRIRTALRAKLISSKSHKSTELLGCDTEYFKQYIELKFKSGMNWNNYGKIWHIDHIKPCSNFDLSKPEEQKICFNHTNLQPLWATTEIARKYGDAVSVGNLNKGDKIFI